MKRSRFDKQQVKPSHTPEELRRLAARTKDANQSRRLLSIAVVLDGMSRAEAAKFRIDYHELSICKRWITEPQHFNLNMNRPRWHCQVVAYGFQGGSGYNFKLPSRGNSRSTDRRRLFGRGGMSWLLGDSGGA